MEEWVQVQVNVPSSRLGDFYQTFGRWLQPTEGGESNTGGVDESGAQEDSVYLLHQRDDDWRKGPSELRIRDARNLYRILSDGARHFLDYLMDRPGERIGADDLAQAIGAESRSGVSGRLASFGFNLKKSGNRSYPFLWTKGSDGSRYWMEPDVAELFREARQASR